MLLRAMVRVAAVLGILAASGADMRAAGAEAFQRVVVAPHTTGVNAYPCMARLADGRFLAVWCAAPANVYLGKIERQANQKASWTSAILTLVVTVAIFFAVGWGDEGWQSLLLIAGVLFLHELGHLVAMWQFRYRNLRMFFIPFFGAAVSGQNYNLPGWKKAINPPRSPRDSNSSCARSANASRMAGLEVPRRPDHSTSPSRLPAGICSCTNRRRNPS